MSGFKPMLAADCDGDVSKLRFPLLASVKIDGIRAIVRNGKLVTRSLKPVPNDFIRAALERPEFEGLDGELVNVDDPADFQKTSSAVMKKTGEPDMMFYVFDLTQPLIGRESFEQRLADASAIVFKSPTVGVDVMMVHHNRIDDEADLIDYETETLEEGWEGVMLRDPAGKYKHGRSTLKEGGLVKLKRFADAEAVIVGFEERMHNSNEAFKDELGRTKRSNAQAGKVGRGDLGAFVLHWPNKATPCTSCRGDDSDCSACYATGYLGVEFTCGSGLTDTQRTKFWAQQLELSGTLLKFKHLPHGAKDAPRHPVFLGIRDERDL